jgi:hypothetical protein
MISVTSMPFPRNLARYSSIFSAGTSNATWFIEPIALIPWRPWIDSPRTPSGALGEPEERDPVDTVAHVEEEVLPTSLGQLECLHELHAEHVLVPSDGLGHVAAHQREMIDAAELELRVRVPGRSHGVSPPPTARPHYDALAYSPAVPRLREIPKSEADAPIVQSM